VIKKTPFFIIMMAVVILSLLLSFCGGILANSLFDGNRGIPQNVTINPTDEVSTTEAVAKKALDSVVGITTTIQGEGDFFQRQTETTGEGSGLIVDANGYILTNSHVIGDGNASKVVVLLSDGEKVNAELLWNDATIDLAIIKVGKKGLKPVEFGDSDEIAIGQYVAAIGNPLGTDFSGSVTQGVVSGLNRNITASDGVKSTQMEGLIQVDAAINPGNSGGPLLDNKGEVIGVNTAKASAEGMGFAIPINTAIPIIEKVLSTGSFDRVYMGVSTVNASVIAENYPNLELSQKDGAFITAITENSPADKAGLEIEDIITEVDGKVVSTSTALIKCLLGYEVGDTVRITYLRGEQKSTAKVKLAAYDDVYSEAPSGTNPLP
jgi:S1-C subfamily serine protease